MLLMANLHLSGISTTNYGDELLKSVKFLTSQTTSRLSLLVGFGNSTETQDADGCV